jgi:hypothetical protein
MTRAGAVRCACTDGMRIVALELHGCRVMVYGASRRPRVMKPRDGVLSTPYASARMRLGGEVMTDYEGIAHAYRESKRLPIKQYSEEFTFFQVLGSLRNLTVLDVACEDGYYIRALKHQGATHIMDVDRSPTMITLAQREEATHPLSIAYVVGEAEWSMIRSRAAVYYSTRRRAGIARSMKCWATRRLNR